MGHGPPMNVNRTLIVAVNHPQAGGFLADTTHLDEVHELERRRNAGRLGHGIHCRFSVRLRREDRAHRGRVDRQGKKRDHTGRAHGLDLLE